MTRSIVLIHGAWVTPLCWESFQPFFEERGYSAIAPPWPGKEDLVEAQRLNPSPTLKGLGIGEIVDHYERILAELSEPAFLVGHSYGGLFVQLLLDRGLGAAGVAIDSAPPRGAFAYYPSTLRSLSRVLLSWQGWRRILRTPFADFRCAFVNNMTPEQQRSVYDRRVVPETGRIFLSVGAGATEPEQPGPPQLPQARPGAPAPDRRRIRSHHPRRDEQGELQPRSTESGPDGIQGVLRSCALDHRPRRLARGRRLHRRLV